MYAYLSSDYELSNRGKWLYGYAIPLVDGCSTQLELVIAQEVRRQHKWLIDKAEYLGGWTARGAFENNTWPTIYRVPLNVMTDARKAPAVYGSRYRDDTGAYWGALDTPVSDQEFAERAARQKYRQENRDAEDPMKALSERAIKRLPKPPKNPRPLYIAYDYRVLRRSIGVFDSYDTAVATAPTSAQIIELFDDGRTKLLKGNLRRGHFRSGWGYSSGFAPDARAARARS